MPLIEFLNLGKQPIANGFVDPDDHTPDIDFVLRAGFCDDTYLVSLMEHVDKDLLFTDKYAYHSSGSETMRLHFAEIAEEIKQLKPRKVLEIGSNDGVFLRHFDPSVAVAVEPCKNFAFYTSELGYETYDAFWTMELANRIRDEHGPVDVVYAANCMCHIPDIAAAFGAVERVLADGGLFVFEDPAVGAMLHLNSYDQIYDEHAHLFSVVALRQLLDDTDMVIWRVQNLPVHGGSNRVWVKKTCTGGFPVESSVGSAIQAERNQGLDRRRTFTDFRERVQKSKQDLVALLQTIKGAGKKVIGYGATSKSTVIYNYCGIGPDLIDYVVDTTPNKQGMMMPGVHIPIISPEEGMNDTVDFAFLGAWNYLAEITAKESEFLLRGGKFITHVPGVRVVELPGV